MTIYDTDETITDPAELGTSSVDLNPDELRAVDGIITTSMPADPADTWRPPSSRLRTEPEYGNYITRLLDKREPWQAIATPQTVRDARAATDAAIAADQAVRREFADLPRREAAEHAAIGKAAVEGKEVPPLTDWARERLMVLARSAELTKRTKAAGKAEAEAVSAALPSWLLALRTEIEPARQEAVQAFQGVQAKFAAWQSAIRAAHAVDAALHPGDERPTTVDDETREIIGRGKGAPAALAALLNSDHPVVTGAYLDRAADPARPPLYVREAMSNGNGSAWSQLTAIELAENYSVTDYTREEARQRGLISEDERRLRGPIEDYTFQP